MGNEIYTYEDYNRDFELDYLGFHGVPPESGPDECTETITGSEPEAGDFCEIDHCRCEKYKKAVHNK